MDVIWLTEMHSPGLVAMNILCSALVSLPCQGKLGHCPKKAACALGWQNLGKLLWDLIIEGELLELRKAQVAKVVVPLHELSLVGGGRELDIFNFLYQG